MANSQIAIVAGNGDPEAIRIHSALDALRADIAWFNAPAFPEQLLHSLPGVRKPAPRAAYLRGLACHPLSPKFGADLRERPRGVIAQCDETRAYLESLLLDWQRRGTRLVNSLEANAQHSRKPYQLTLLDAAGLPTPNWLATNDPAAVRAFVDDVGPCIYKPLAGGATVRALDPADLAPERLAQLQHAPVLFQERVDGVSVRAYVVDGRVVAAAEIYSTDLDYRRDEQAVVKTTLSTREDAAVCAAAVACGLAFSGVDLIRSANDRFVIIECNPSPMFAVFEQKTSQDVAGPLAQLLSKT